MKRKVTKRLTALAMAIVFFFTAFPVTEVAKAAGSPSKEPIYYWYRPQNSDDIPKDQTFRILMIDEVNGGGRTFTDTSYEGTTVTFQVDGGKEYYYLKGGSFNRNGNHSGYELALTKLSDSVSHQIDFGANEFFTIGDLGTPYCRRLKEVENSNERDKDGYTGWVSGEFYKRHQSKNSANVDENSPLIRISINGDFSTVNNTYNQLYYQVNTNQKYGGEYDLVTSNSKVQDNYKDNFSYMRNSNDIFEFVVNPDYKAGENAAYTQEGTYISHVMLKQSKTSAETYDEALYFSYFSGHLYDSEISQDIRPQLNNKMRITANAQAGVWHYNDIPSYVKGTTWEFKSTKTSASSGSSRIFALESFGTVHMNTKNLNSEMVFRSRDSRDSRDPYSRTALTSGLLHLPKIYIGIPNHNVSEIKPNNASTNTYTVPKDQTELIANNSYLRGDRKMIVPKGATLIVSGWLILHGELVIDGGTVIVDSGGCISYLEQTEVGKNDFGGDAEVNNSTFIIMQGGKVNFKHFTGNNSTIINYGLFMTDYDYRVNTTLEARRYSTTYESAGLVYPTYSLAKKNFTDTGKGNGYPSNLTVTNGTDYPGNGGIKGNTSKIIVSDMANKYSNPNKDKTNQHIQPETYYEKQ